MDAWVQSETEKSAFGDARLGERLAKLLGDFSQRIGQSIPLACQDWAATKAAYRFLDNPEVDEAAILAGHFQATRERSDAFDGPLLVLHDTTEFSYKRSDGDAVGKTCVVQSGHKQNGRQALHTVCGLLMHASLVVTTQGLPLGLAAIKFWTRKKFKGTNALKGKVNATRIPIEEKESYRWIASLRQATKLLESPQRCVHIGDRESDIYELFCAAQDAETSFLVRTCVDRLAEEGNTTIEKQIKKGKRGRHLLEIVDRHGRTECIELDVRFHQMIVRPPIGKQRKYPALELSVIQAREKTRPKDRERIEWKLLTDLPVSGLRSAVEKLDWYALRWKIETFFKILKSGCKAEEAKLRTAARLTNLIAIYCIVSWRIFWLCMINRTDHDAPASLVFTKTEQRILDHIDPKPPGHINHTVSHYLLAVARLGGYLSRARDRPPGNMVLWRGFNRLIDVHLGYCIANGTVGN
jgi:hypothetical protein